MTTEFAGLPVADAEDAGFCPDRLERIAGVMDAAAEPARFRARPP